mmetsp:Transcript_9633/g.28866  ORF Transcript_9633/g.28866 Transcript_9633/m.28866 type:complete len:110 (-) Transcript_9633:291-620(-)|eukprot:CAMPEP_0113581432 /NCGR_PEP_ID=MMETSP0015_2-20120614/31294_1 /TAXON_ID=2838 /ORGANISM="Odontella" /LENGTH=109 /DNA_ID=CAMNT_0000485869 /DNA_START=328 /DNA_END=657 /DNA_ORIENTATION=+ /assembly_acc=CAM_ASM_000160
MVHWQSIPRDLPSSALGVDPTSSRATHRVESIGAKCPHHHYWNSLLVVLRMTKKWLHRTFPSDEEPYHKRIVPKQRQQSLVDNGASVALKKIVDDVVVVGMGWVDRLPE